MADVFISYSRRDKDFVEVLHKALVASQYNAWIDWQDIAPTTEWWKEIEAGIEAAHTFLFVISQDSVKSDYCRKEIDHAVHHGKRLIPILRRKDFDRADLHPKLGQHQWVVFQEQDDFDQAFATLLTAIDTDLEHKKAHTRLQVRAIEWEQSSQDPSLLLRGRDLDKAEQWLLQASANKDPKPTALQGSYIAASRESTTEEQARVNRLQRLTMAGLSGLLVLATGAGIWAWVQQQKALTGETNAQFLADSLTMEAYLESGLEKEAVTLAMQTGQAMQGKPAGLRPDRRFRAITSIREVMYGLKESGQLIGHSDWVNSVAFSPDRETIATASADGTVKLWNLQGEELQTLKGHSGGVNSVAFSPDGETIATASDDRTVKLWNSQGEELQTLKGHSAWATSIAFSPDGKTISTASLDGTVKLWSRQGMELQTLKGHSGGVNSVAFSPDGETIATASWDQTVKLWNLQGGEPQTLKGHSDGVNSIAFSPDGKAIATASADRTVKLWNLQGEELQTLKGHSDWINSVAFSPNGETIFTASVDQTVKLWSRQGEELQTLKGPSEWVLSVAFSPDGETIASANDDGTVKLWSRHGEELQTLRGHSGPVRNVAFSPDGETIASANDDGTVKLWSRQGEELQTLKGRSDWVNSVAFSPDGELIATASADRTVKLWNLQGEELQTLKGHSDWVNSVAFNPNGELIATASADRTVKLWNLQGEELQTLKGHSSFINSVAFSPDGELIATASADRTVKLWNLQGEELQTLKGHSSFINSVALSPDGETIATASADRTVKLWNLQGGELQTLRGHSSFINSVAFSPDGETIATASADETVKLWSRQGEELQTLKDHSSWVSSVAFSPDGETIATASGDGTVKLWNFDLDNLVDRGCNWLKTYLIKQSPELLMELEVCQQQNPAWAKAAAPTLLTQADRVARDGNPKKAIAWYRQAQNWDGQINLDSKDRAEKLARFGEGIELVQKGSIKPAIESFQAVQSLDPPLNYTIQEVYDSWDSLCWEGSVQGHAAEVMFACEQAVALAPGNGVIVNSRGLARALTGDIPGAIADFNVFIKWTYDEESRAQRQGWIEALEQGENPFTPEVLESLREDS